MMGLDFNIDNLLKCGLNIQEATELFNKPFEEYILQCNSGNFYFSRSENKFYTGEEFYKKTYFQNGNLRFPYNYPDLIEEYFNLALAEFLEKQKIILGLLFNETDQFNKFLVNEIERSQHRIENQKEFLLKNKHHKFESKENDIKVCEAYIQYLKRKKDQPDEVKPDEVKPDEVENKHPKFNPNYWNKECFELFKYLYDCYYKKTKRQLTNIWFYLKEHKSETYVLKATKDEYIEFILKSYQIQITNFDKAILKWEEKELITINDHRIDFEDTLK